MSKVPGGTLGAHGHTQNYKKKKTFNINIKKKK